MITQDQTIKDIEDMAVRMRKVALRLALSAGNNGSHLGSGLSIIEILAVLYGGILRFDPQNPRWDGRDRFILSKGHGTLGYYAALAESGFISEKELATFEVNGGNLPGQPVMNLDLGIEFSSGSLGHGLSLGIGTALVGKSNEKKYRVFVLMGDGECNEGTVWEAAMAAKHYNLTNLVAIIDANNLQSDGACRDIMCVNYDSLWRGVGWNVTVVNGHSVSDLLHVFREDVCDNPRVIIANTIKGRGVSFMENNNDWHHNRLTKVQYDAALAEQPLDGDHTCR